MDGTITLKEYLSDVLMAFRVRDIIINENHSDLTYIDFSYRKQLFVNYNYKSYFKKITAQVLPGQPIEYCDEFSFYYFCFIEPDYEPISYHIFGPYLYELPFNENDYDSFEAFARERGIPVSYYKQVISFFDRIPIIKDMLTWKHILIKIVSKYLNTEFAFCTASYNESIMQYKEDHFFDIHAALDYTSLEARYEAEHKMLNAIKNGDTKNALKFHNEFMAFSFENRIPDALANAKSYLVAANTLFRKAVEEAQVHPLYIDQLSGRFSIEIENARSMTQLNQINTTMIRKYCMLVQTYSREQYSELIRKCLNYIDFHYQEKLSLLYIAKKFAVSKNYLSTLFHNEVSMTITDYINTTRVRQAIKLLNTTSLSMQDISECCGFSDANYFTRTFKKIQGMSPLKYRQSLISTNL